MRIGALVLLYDGYCYQSYNWNKFRPLGKLQDVVNSLEEYKCDEISIIRPIKKEDTIDGFKKDIKLLSTLNTMTPISFGGGLRSKEQIDLLHTLPIERIIFTSLFIESNKEIIEYTSKRYGHQAIQCLLPCKIDNSKLQVFNSIKNKYFDYNKLNKDFIIENANEIIIIDTVNEGKTNKFNHNIIDKLNIDNSKLIISGGIGEEEINYARSNKFASVLVDNKILHSEYSIKRYKNVK